MRDGWVRLRLDADRFDPDAFAAGVERCRRAGITFATIADLGDDDANPRRLYGPNRECSADIPGRGEFYTYPDYLAERIEVPSYDPAAVVLALHGDRWVGMSAASHHGERGFFFNEMTGVVRSHRGRGIALAMKVLAHRVASQVGLRRLGRPAGISRRAPVRRPEWSTMLRASR